MKTLFAAALMLVLASPAIADCEQIATGRQGKGIYQCDTPSPPSAPAVCKMIHGTLICDGEISERHPPRNCGYRRGAYACW